MLGEQGRVDGQVRQPHDFPPGDCCYHFHPITQRIYVANMTKSSVQVTSVHL